MKNFSLTLYAFHLHHTLTDASGEVDVDAKQLWESLVNLAVKDYLPFPGLKNLRSKLICYQNDEYEPKRELSRNTEWLTDFGAIDLGALPTTEGWKINGNLQPFLLNDTYAVDITLLPEPADISIDIPQLQHFRPIYLLPSHIKASLGQIIWIYGEVDASVNCQELANKFAVALVAGTNLNPVETKKGELFGSLLFEYQASDHDEPDNPTKQSDIFILINNSQSHKIKLANDAYDWLLNLLCSYKKIFYTYHQARQRYQEAKVIYSYLQNKIQIFNNLIRTSTSLSELKKLLIELPTKKLDYTRCLQDLQTHLTTIDTNIANYKTCLDKIVAIDGDNSSLFWQEFLDKDCQKIIKQIQIDIKYLSPGQELFGEIVNTIRGLVEIQQAESDYQIQQLLRDNETAAKERERHLNKTIGAFSFGLIATSMATGSSRYLIAQDPGTYPTRPPFKGSAREDFLLSFGVGIPCGLFAALIWWIVISSIQSYSQRRNNERC